MDTQLLEAFVAVARCNSFSIAAEQVHITQPAISKRIAQLEGLLNCRLFDRISRTIYLTEAGQTLLPRAEKILREIDETHQAIRDVSGHISGNLRIAISHHIGLHRLPPVLKEFTTRYQNVNPAVEFMDSEAAYEAVLHGRFEVGIITLAPEPHQRILSQPIWQDSLEPMVSRDHPLAHKRKVTVEELSEYLAILPGPETYTGRMIKTLFDEGGFNLNATMATNYLETIKMLVSVGLGWSILPRIMADDSLRVLSCKDIRLSRDLGYISHRDKTLSNAARAFIALLEGGRDHG